MAYNVNQKATLDHLKALAVRTKSAIDTAIASLPQEMYLDNTKSAFVENFVFNATTYPGAANPNLDGKPVLVFAVKTIDHTNNNAETLTYSFLNLLTLVDVYTVKAGDSSNVLNLAGHEFEFKIDPSSDILSITANGLKVDASGKADKAANPTAGHVAGLDANGNPTDTGIVATEVLTTADVATNAECTEMLNEVFGAV